MEMHRAPAGESAALCLHFCGWEKCAPGHAFGPAVRRHYLFHFILRGTGFFERGGRRVALEAGQGFLILPGESTFYAASQNDPWEYCWIGFDGADAPRLLRECGLGADNFVFTDRSGGLLREEMLELVALFDRPESNEYTRLGQLYRCLSRMVTRPPAQAAPGREYTEQALAFLRRNFSYDIRVTDVARHVGIDRTYLFRLFRQYVGLSPRDYLMRLRLRAAAELLTAGRLTVTEAALSCGFQSLSVFDKQFKKQYGVSPMQYRRRAAEA